MGRNGANSCAEKGAEASNMSRHHTLSNTTLTTCTTSAATGRMEDALFYEKILHVLRDWRVGSSFTVFHFEELLLLSHCKYINHEWISSDRRPVKRCYVSFGARNCTAQSFILGGKNPYDSTTGKWRHERPLKETVAGEFGSEMFTLMGWPRSRITKTRKERTSSRHPIINPCSLHRKR